MSVRSLSILACITIALFGYIVLVEKDSLTDAETAGRGARLIERFARARVERIVVRRGGETIEMVLDAERSGPDPVTGAEESAGAWDLVSPEAAAGRADESAVSTLLGALEFARPRRTISEVTADDLERFGLDPAAVEIELDVGGSRTTVRLGTADTTEAGRYASVTTGGDDDAQRAYVVGTDIFEAADHALDHWRGKQLFPDPFIDLDNIRREHAGRSLHLALDGQDWWLREPEVSLASTQRVRDIRRGLGDLEATRFTEQPLGETWLRLTGQSKPRQDALVRPFELVVGDACLGQEGERVAQAKQGEDEGPLVCVSEADLRDLLRAPSGLRELRPITASDTDVEAVEIVAGNDRLVLTDDEGEWTFESTESGRTVEGEVDPDALSEWLSDLRRSEAEEVEPLNDADLARHGFENPRATITLRGRGDASDQVVALGNADMRGVRVRRGEEASMLIVPISIEAHFTASPAAFRPRRLLYERPEALATLRNTRGDTTETVERDGDGEFQVTEPVALPANGSRARELASRLGPLEAVRFVASRPSAEHGLSGASVRTVVMTFDGAAPDVDAADLDALEDDGHGHGHGAGHDGADGADGADGDTPSRTHTLKVGAATEGGRFAQLDDDPAVFVLPTVVAEALEAPLLSLDLLRTPRSQVSALILTRGDDVVRIRHDGAQFVTEAGQPANADTTLELTTALERVRPESAARASHPGVEFTLRVERNEDGAEPRTYTIHVGPGGDTTTTVWRGDMEGYTYEVPNAFIAPWRDYAP